jgi:hypothetical protein
MVCEEADGLPIGPFPLSDDRLRKLGNERFGRPEAASVMPVDWVEMRVRLHKAGDRLASGPAPERGEPPEAELRQLRHEVRRDPVPGRHEHRQERVAESCFGETQPFASVVDKVRERAIGAELGFLPAILCMVGMGQPMDQDAGQRLPREPSSQGCVRQLWNGGDGERDAVGARQIEKAIEGRRVSDRIVVAPPELDRRLPLRAAAQGLVEKVPRQGSLTRLRRRPD